MAKLPNNIAAYKTMTVIVVLSFNNKVLKRGENKLLYIVYNHEIIGYYHINISGCRKSVTGTLSRVSLH